MFFNFSDLPRYQVSPSPTLYLSHNILLILLQNTKLMKTSLAFSHVSAHGALSSLNLPISASISWGTSQSQLNWMVSPSLKISLIPSSPTTQKWPSSPLYHMNAFIMALITLIAELETVLEFKFPHQQGSYHLWHYILNTL